MPDHLKPARQECAFQRKQRAGVVQLENDVAAMAAEVMMMRVSGRLEAGTFARQMHRDNLPLTL